MHREFNAQENGGHNMSGKERTQPKSITEHPTFNIADNLGINSAQKSDL